VVLLFSKTKIIKLKRGTKGYFKEYPKDMDNFLEQ